ncbi:hypothetical protein HGM15179_018480 [Zosterops borbonicus]|uniref:Uncharacterized protein n=1 Tax=Zosterops borbonicus TaxID=364589 RepID=A0A8K1LC37_9PASS|nr:hypothetical protein HGM15179_018480 [Zosterops borbonicus]
MGYFLSNLLKSFEYVYNLERSFHSQGPSEYSNFMATMHFEDNQESVGSVASKVGNYESMDHGLMQTHVSAVVESLKEEMREEIRDNSFHVAPVKTRGPNIKA